MKLRFAVAVLALFASLGSQAFGQATQPTVYNTTINYTSNVITIVGKGFDPINPSPYPTDGLGISDVKITAIPVDTVVQE